MRLGLVMPRPPAVPPVLFWAAFGFVFWALVVLALEPGNVMRALNDGRTLSGIEEARRILGASLLGAAITPVQAALVRRLRLAPGRVLRNLALLALLLPALAFVLLAAADILRPLVLSAGNPRLSVSFVQQATADFPILLYALAAATALMQVIGRGQAGPAPRAAQSVPASAYAARIAAPTASGAAMVDVADIDWLESQGNYVALHAGAETHLVRMTLTQMQAQLDPAIFLRVHRRVLVNRTRLARMTRLSSGDARVFLDDGTELRASRTYAETLREAFR